MQIPKNVVEVFSADHMAEIIESNEFGPEINEEMCERLIDLAAMRTETRMQGDTLDTGQKDYLVMTTWDNFCRETFGSSGKAPNRFALATIDFEVSSGRDAYLCNDAMSVQQKWLESGDERCTQMEEIDQTNTEFHDEKREFWSPKDYTAVIAFANELVTPDPKLEDAM